MYEGANQFHLNLFVCRFPNLNSPIFSIIFWVSGEIFHGFFQSFSGQQRKNNWTRLLMINIQLTLVYPIEVHARLLILRKKSTLHGLILVCTFIDFEKTFPPARLLVSTIFHCCNFFASETEQQSYNGYLLTFIFQSCLLKRFMSINFLL